MGFTVELFRLRDKNVPVDVLDIPNRVVDIKFEPGATTTRFALVTEATAPGRFTIAFYQLAEKGGVVPLFSLEDKMHNCEWHCSFIRWRRVFLPNTHNIHTVVFRSGYPPALLREIFIVFHNYYVPSPLSLPLKRCTGHPPCILHAFCILSPLSLLPTAVHWSPRGEHIVLAAMANSNNHGQLEFYDCEHKKSFASAEHSQLSGLDWDPSGRMLATYKVQPVNREPTTRETVQVRELEICVHNFPFAAYSHNGAFALSSSSCISYAAVVCSPSQHS